MGAWDSFTLMQPLWLLVLPLAFLMQRLLRQRGGGAGAWAGAVDAHLLQALDRLGRVLPGVGRAPLAPLLIACLAALALSGPATRQAEPESFRNLDGLVLVLDLSPSMTAPATLARLRAAALAVLARAGARSTALVVFAGDAYLASPFSADAAVLGQTIAALGPDLVPDPGSRPERALALAAGMLGQARILGGDVVLIGDGGGIGDEALEAARALRVAGGRLSTILTAPARSAAEVPEPDPAALAALARAGGGLTLDPAAPGTLDAALGGGFDTRLERSGLSALIWRDHGRWLIALALLPALLLFRRSA